MATASPYIWGTGRRKTAVARVRLSEGSGKISVNGKDLAVYFAEERDRRNIWATLEVSDLVDKLDLNIKCKGGGYAGQAGAVILGIARAVKTFKPDAESALRDHGMLTRDSREVERKKYGQPGARKRFQFSKR